MMSLQKNNYAFIDSQNLNLAIRDLGWQLDFKRFRVYLKDKYAVSKAFIFIGYVPTNESLYTSLQSYGYILIFKSTLNAPGGKIKGNIDAELVLHAMIEYPNYDKAVIVTGDGDFHCLIEYLKKQGKIERLIVPNRHEFSSLLRKFAPFMDSMNNLSIKLGYTNKKEA
ncbi:MAG: NYN domain-containing protein [Candidatus Omnitrophica bacterium]|nr:NYN domain-containing protein [Candidatus Omnitrophota bacterium]